MSYVIGEKSFVPFSFFISLPRRKKSHSFKNFIQLHIPPLLYYSFAFSCYLSSHFPTMVKNQSKGKQRQSLRTSISQKYSKANRSSLLGRRSKSLVPAVESFESEPDEDMPHQSVRVETTDDESHHSSVSSSPERVSPRPMITRLAASRTRIRSSTPKSTIVPATLSSTISKWMAKKATTPNDQDTRQLLGQLATVPLQGSSEYDKAHNEAVQGLTKGSHVQPSSSSSSKTKNKGKVCQVLFCRQYSNCIRKICPVSQDCLRL
jgi:hypothetical protein